MRLRHAALLATTVLALAVTPAAGLLPAYAEDFAPAAAAEPDTTSEAEAEEALETVQEVLAGDSDADPTLALVQLQQAVDDLPRELRDDARALMARPTSRAARGADDAVAFEAAAVVEKQCGAHVCVHHEVGTTNSPPSAAWVTTVLETMETAWTTEVDTLGFTAPPSDAALPDNGGDGLVDVYLWDTGASGLYGFAQPEANTQVTPGYLVLDNDFAEFPAPPLVSLQATGAHEFFHLVQFGYDQLEDHWFMESTATWMEEQVFDEANDNRAYLPASSLRNPTRSLDHPDARYGNWVWFEFLSTRYNNPAVVRMMWEEAAFPDTWSPNAMNRALNRFGSTLSRELPLFGAASTVPFAFIPEGTVYPRAPYARRLKLTIGNRSTGTRTDRLNHLASRPSFVYPGPSLRGRRWKLRISVNGPSGITRATALVFLRTGAVVTVPIGINRYGNGARTVPFSQSSVAGVSVTTTNISVRYADCGGDVTGWACDGDPVDQGRYYRWSARAFR